jgi:hypothetical protein
MNITVLLLIAGAVFCFKLKMQDSESYLASADGKTVKIVPLSYTTLAYVLDIIQYDEIQGLSLFRVQSSDYVIERLEATNKIFLNPRSGRKNQYLEMVSNEDDTVTLKQEGMCVTVVFDKTLEMAECNNLREQKFRKVPSTPPGLNSLRPPPASALDRLLPDRSPPNRPPPDRPPPDRPPLNASPPSGLSGLRPPPASPLDRLPPDRSPPDRPPLNASPPPGASSFGPPPEPPF